MVSRPARVAILEQLRADGVRYMFGNPGTVEQGFLDELRNFPELEYVLALQEATAVGMADGHARATRTPTVCQLHTGVGLGNGIGMLYQAMRGHALLVVLALRVGPALRGHGGADGRRPGRHGGAGHQVGHPGGGPGVHTADPAPGVQGGGHAPVRPRPGGAARRRDGPGHRRGGRADVVPRHAEHARRGGPRPGGGTPRRCRAPDRRHAATVSTSPRPRRSLGDWRRCGAPRCGARTGPRSTCRPNTPPTPVSWAICSASPVGASPGRPTLCSSWGRTRCPRSIRSSTASSPRAPRSSTSTWTATRSPRTSPSTWAWWPIPAGRSPGSPRHFRRG